MTDLSNKTTRDTLSVRSEPHWHVLRRPVEIAPHSGRRESANFSYPGGRLGRLLRHGRGEIDRRGVSSFVMSWWQK
jgi:hypothetical protein